MPNFPRPNICTTNFFILSYTSEKAQLIMDFFDRLSHPLDGFCCAAVFPRNITRVNQCVPNSKLPRAPRGVWAGGCGPCFLACRRTVGLPLYLTSEERRAFPRREKSHRFRCSRGWWVPGRLATCGSRRRFCRTGCRTPWLLPDSRWKDSLGVPPRVFLYCISRCITIS